MENVETVENQSTQDVASQDTPQVDAETQSPDANNTALTATDAKKWKLKVYGEEKEYSEPEVVKFAQLGAAGQKAMEKAALAEKKQREFYGWLRSAMETDPMQVYEIITGKKYQGTQAPQVTEQGEVDQRDTQLRHYQERLHSLEAKLEAQEIEKERQAIESELDSAVSKYPELNNPFLKSYVKQEYRKVLKAGVEDMSIDDVAFYVAQEFKNQQVQKAQTIQNKFNEKTKQAPVMTKPTQSSGQGNKKMTLDDVKRLAGRQV